MNHSIKPPHLASRLFEWYCENASIEDLHGDMEELFYANLEKMSARKAKLKYWQQIFSLLFSYAIKKRKKKSAYHHFAHSSNFFAMIRNYLTVAMRSLLKNKGYSFINIFGLATGMTIAMVIGLWMYDELSYDHYNPKYDRVAQVIQNLNNNGEIDTWWNVPFPLSEELQKNYGSDFKHIAMVLQWGEHVLTVEDKKIMETGIYAEKDGVSILGLQMAQGSINVNDPASVLISAKAAQNFFGDEDPINKMIKIDDMPLVKVAGVYQNIPANSRFAHINFIATWDFLYANSAWMKNSEDPWRPNFATLFVEINDNTNFESVSTKIKDAKLKKLNEHLAKKKPALFLHPMSKWHLYAEFKNGVNTGGAIQYVWMFGIIGAFVLLLACINFMNLSTARNEKRAKEVGIRKTIGSFRLQLIFQFFSESFLTVALAFAFALVLTQLALPLFNQVADKQMFMLWRDPLFWLASAAFITLTSLLAGSYPAFYLSSFKPIQVLKGTFKAGRYAAIPRKILVTVQFTVSVTLIIGTIIIYQQIQFAKNRPVGYSREHLITVPTMNKSIHDHVDAVKNELMSAGAITTMAESESPTTSIWNSTSGFSWPGKDPSLSTDIGAVIASFDYGATIGWEIKEGRSFSRDFVSDSSAIILNEAAVQFTGLKNPLGETVTWWGRPLTVIGVVKNMVMESPYDEPRPVIYTTSKDEGNMVILKLNAATPTHLALAKIEEVFKKNNPEQPFEYKFVDEDYARKFNNEERIGTLASVFAILAILISLLGLFGLASFVAEQRTKEIGVRKVMGASVFHLWKMLSKDFVLLVVISIFISTPIAYYFMKGWLQKYNYHTEIEWWVFTAAGVSALLITLLTVSYQSIKAALANPVNSLRSE